MRALGCTVALLLAALLSLGGPAAFAADVTGSTSIRASALVFNRATNTFDTTVTVTNTGPVSLASPIRLIPTPSVAGITLANPSGTSTDGKPFVQVPTVQNQLNQGQSGSVVLRFNNPSRQSFTLTYRVEAVQVSAGLPPDPGPAGEATLLGIDSDRDGVRDDVQRYIAFTYPNSERIRLALLEIARNKQAAFQATTPSAALTVQRSQLRNFMCLEYVAGLTSAGNMLDLLIAEYINTQQRHRAEVAYSQLLAGQALESPDREAAAVDCSFDPSTRAN